MLYALRIGSAPEVGKSWGKKAHESLRCTISAPCGGKEKVPVTPACPPNIDMLANATINNFQAPSPGVARPASPAAAHPAHLFLRTHDCIRQTNLSDLFFEDTLRLFDDMAAKSRRGAAGVAYIFFLEEECSSVVGASEFGAPT